MVNEHASLYAVVSEGPTTGVEIDVGVRTGVTMTQVLAHLTFVLQLSDPTQKRVRKLLRHIYLSKKGFLRQIYLSKSAGKYF